MQLLTAAGIIVDIDMDVVDVIFRKKLFRFEAGASPGVGE